MLIHDKIKERPDFKSDHKTARQCDPQTLLGLKEVSIFHLKDTSNLSNLIT
jgi:hypothetical protein